MKAQPVTLRELLDACQVERAEEWQLLPGGGPAERMLTGLVDVAPSDAPPALAALQHLYRGVYAPDPRLGLAWGMPAEDSRDIRQVDAPEWMPTHWSGVALRYAHVLLNGAMIWQVAVAQVNWGAGVSGVIAWPTQEHIDRETISEPYPSAGWWVEHWEASFAGLLNTLAGHGRDFDYEREMAAASIALVQGHPLGRAVPPNP